MRNGWRAAAGVFFAVLAAACGSRGDMHSLVGGWETKPYTSQMGPTVMACTFTKEGHYDMTVRMSVAPRGQEVLRAPLGDSPR